MPGEQGEGGSPGKDFKAPDTSDQGKTTPEGKGSRRMSPEEIKKVARERAPLANAAGEANLKAELEALQHEDDLEQFFDSSMLDSFEQFVQATKDNFVSSGQAENADEAERLYKEKCESGAEVMYKSAKVVESLMKDPLYREILDDVDQASDEGEVEKVLESRRRDYFEKDREDFLKNISDEEGNLLVDPRTISLVEMNIDIISKVAEQKNVPTIMIMNVNDGSPAEQAGLRRSDIVKTVNGKDVEIYPDLIGELERSDTAKIDISRDDGDTTLEVVPKEGKIGINFKDIIKIIEHQVLLAEAEKEKRRRRE